jgi:hypothetical protein
MTTANRRSTQSKKYLATSWPVGGAQQKAALNGAGGDLDERAGRDVT